MKQVLQWLAEGREVTIARVVDTRGISSRDRAATIGWTPGQPLAGELFHGAANEDLPQLLAETPLGFVDFRVGEDAATRAGLACGGVARLYLQPAATIPSEAWQALAAARPVALLTDVRTGATVLDTSRTGVSATELDGDQLRTAYWPTPRLLIVGAGAIAEALMANARLLGWPASVVSELPELGPSDSLIVLEHDLEISGSALRTALNSDVGYIGALGSRHTQARRAKWLAEHDVTDLQAIHGPAGLDIGSRTPAEIALSILAEIVLLRR